MKFWNTIATELEAGYSVVLMYVVESIGSSPGRQGFKMMVSQSGVLHGSIGGGIMEHKWVEHCKSYLLKATPFKPFIKDQIHKDGIPHNKSGMICSGEQTIAFFYLAHGKLPLINNIETAYSGGQKLALKISNKGISLKPLTITTQFELTRNKLGWHLLENIHYAPKLHIIGGGHVSHALSKLAKEVGFTVFVYDDRPTLNTMEQNKFATAITIKDYSNITRHISKSDASYVVIMSFGYKTDKIILKSILSANYYYTGMMGSQAKIETLFSELLNEGISKKQLNRVFAPIGLPISSKTPSEIAVSILAQLIKIKNKI